MICFSRGEKVSRRVGTDEGDFAGQSERLVPLIRPFRGTFSRKEKG